MSFPSTNDALDVSIFQPSEAHHYIRSKTTKQSLSFEQFPTPNYNVQYFFAISSTTYSTWLPALLFFSSLFWDPSLASRVVSGIFPFKLSIFRLIKFIFWNFLWLVLFAHHWLLLHNTLGISIVSWLLPFLGQIARLLLNSFQAPLDPIRFLSFFGHIKFGFLRTYAPLSLRICIRVYADFFLRYKVSFRLSSQFKSTSFRYLYLRLILF